MRTGGQKIIHWIKARQIWLKLIFMASILFFVVNQVTRILHGISWKEITAAASRQGAPAIAAMIVIGLLAVGPMLLTDHGVNRMLDEEGRAPLPMRQRLVAAWIVNTINNLAGFGGVVGISLREHFYRGTHAKGKTLALLSKVALFMFSGLSILAFFALLLSLFSKYGQVAKGYIFWLLVASVLGPVLLLFVYLKRKTLFQNFLPRNIFYFLGGSLGQWSGAAAAFLSIGYLMGEGGKLLYIFPLFIAVTVLGMLSMVPGGMGTFDVLMIMGLSTLSIGREVAVVWILYYRLFYYLLPFASGIILLFTQTGYRVNRLLEGLPKIYLQKVAHGILTAALYFAGLMMVLLSTVTNLSVLNRLFEWLLPYSFHFLDQTLNLLFGLLLLGLARGIYAKVRRAYLPTLAVLTFCLANTIVQTTNRHLIIYFLIVIVAVYGSRKEFYRERLVYSWGGIAADGLLFGFLLVLYAVAGFFTTTDSYNEFIVRNFILFPSDQQWFAGLLGIAAAVLILFSLFYYLSKGGEEIGHSVHESKMRQELGSFLPQTVLEQLPNTTRVFRYAEGTAKVYLLFRRKTEKLFLIGDPLGEAGLFQKAIFQLMKLADDQNLNLVFTKVSPAGALLLHDLGFQNLKLGEAAVISQNSLMKKQQQLLEKFTAEAMVLFYYPYAADNHRLISELSAISSDLTSFEDSSALLVRKRSGELSAATIWGREQFSQDRFTWVSETAPELQKMQQELKDYQLILEAQRQNVRFGFIPGSRVGETRFSFFTERLVNAIYRYNVFHLNLKEEKQSLSDVAESWEPVYFAYRKNCSLLFALLQLKSLFRREKRDNFRWYR